MEFHYSKIAKYEGKEVMFNMSLAIQQWDKKNGTSQPITATVYQCSRHCLISGKKHIAFYVAYASSFFRRPPRKSWMAVGEGE